MVLSFEIRLIEDEIKDNNNIRELHFQALLVLQWACLLHKWDKKISTCRTELTKEFSAGGFLSFELDPCECCFGMWDFIIWISLLARVRGGGG